MCASELVVAECSETAIIQPHEGRKSIARSVSSGGNRNAVIQVAAFGDAGLYLCASELVVAEWSEAAIIQPR